MIEKKILICIMSAVILINSPFALEVQDFAVFQKQKQKEYFLHLISVRKNQKKTKPSPKEDQELEGIQENLEFLDNILEQIEQDLNQIEKDHGQDKETNSPPSKDENNTSQ